MSETGRTAAEDLRYAAALLQFISEGKRVLPSELRAAARRLRKIAQVYWGKEDLMDPIKPGTRCECRGEGHAKHSPYDDSSFMYACYKDAVRRVTVDCARDKFGVPLTPAKRIPMCAACADFHEKAAK